MSAVLTGHWRERRICSQTKDRVLATAHQLGYVPHHAARRLARARPESRETSFDQVGLIHLLGPGHGLDPVCLAMMSGAEPELSKLHACLTFVRVSTHADWQKVERLTRAGGVDGWLVYGRVDDDIENRLSLGKLPFVILGDHRCTRPVHCVTVDNFAVGRQAVEHLAALGHRRIAFLGSNLRYVYEQETLAGFRATLRELDLDDDDRLIGNLSSWTDGAEAPLVDWLRDADPMPSAVFASEYDWAPWVHLMLKEAGIEVPKQISVLGYESASMATQRENFTRIELPMNEVGRRGALSLHGIVMKPGRETSEVRIAPSLIEGWSTCPLHNQGRTEN